MSGETPSEGGRTGSLRRRDLLGAALAGASGLALAGSSGLALAGCSFRRDPEGGSGVAHALATASHDRLLVKLSLHEPLDTPPRLGVDTVEVEGVRTDSRGRFWSFDAGGLRPGATHELVLLDASGRRIHGPWPLRTLPAPGARPERVRLLVFTCAGGHDALRDFLSPRLERVFQPLPVRRALLERGLAFDPDAVIANGDHVYWDLRSRSSLGLGRSPIAWWVAGRFDREAPLIGGPNEAVLHRAVGPQIAELYQTRCQSVPVFFLRDDHDYLENDEADEDLATFPPDDFMRRAARATQHMYYPEFLPDPERPADLPGSSAADRPGGVSESFGTLRWGKLLELLLYDCCGFVSLSGERAGFVPPPVEAWLQERMRASPTDHVVNLPSTPVRWTAGKWLEWYPDVLGAEGQLVIDEAKPQWQPGWRVQHDRLLATASAMRGRIPLFLGGDLHCIAAGTIARSGERDFGANPVVSVLPGPLGTSSRGWPSSFRGVPASPSRTVEGEELLSPIEENGFLILDLSPGEALLRFFRWHPDQGLGAIETLEPFRTLRLPRPHLVEDAAGDGSDER